VRCPGRRPKRPQATLGYLTGGHENQGIHGREAGFRRGRLSGVISELCDPSLSHVYRLDGILDLGDVMTGHRRVVPLAGRKYLSQNRQMPQPKELMRWRRWMVRGCSFGDSSGLP
jgi:hypothetical protein